MRSQSYEEKKSEFEEKGQISVNSQNDTRNSPKGKSELCGKQDSSCCHVWFGLRAEDVWCLKGASRFEDEAGMTKMIDVFKRWDVG